MALQVLLVDDDADLREALREILQLLEGVPCLLAASLDELRRQRPAAMECDLAIIDINLGDGQPSGVDVVRWLKSEGFPGKIMFLTGHGLGDPRVMAAAEVTDTDILSKPISSEELARLIAGVRRGR